MQKKLIALAIAGLSGAAFAQSNVTIYGVMDATYDNVSATGATAPVGGTNTGLNLPSRGRMDFNSSLIGFKGSEAIGNGLTAVFQIETGIYDTPAGSTSAGQAVGNNTWETRDTYVGIAGGFGTLVAGNLTGPTRALGAKMDVNAGATGIGANTAMLAKLGGGSGAGLFDQRIAGGLAYISPNFSGFNGVLAYAPNAGRGTDANSTAPVPPAINGANQLDAAAWTLGLNYENGPIYLGYAYTDIKDSNAGANGSAVTFSNQTTLDLTAGALGLAVKPVNGLAVPIQEVKDNRIGVKYNFGMGTIGVLWDQEKADLATNLGSAQQNVYYIPVTFTVGQGRIIAQYGHADSISFSGNFATAMGAHAAALAPFSDTSANHYELGYEYDLSKRTMLKVLYSHIDNKGGASYDFLYGVNNSNSTSTAGTVQPGSTVSGLSLGLRHSF